MFVDACAIVSILSEEPDAAAYAAALQATADLCTSPMAAWEAVMILARPEKLDLTLALAETVVCEWLDSRQIIIMQPKMAPRDILALAVACAGQGKTGPHKLSGFDCFHYAHAKAEGGMMLTMDMGLRATDLTTRP
jgi:ribonuclease VapC